MRRALLVTALIALVIPSQAFAHATLEQTHPGFRERLNHTPGTIVLQFDQEVTAVPGSIQVFSQRGSIGVVRARNDGRFVKALLPRLPAGPYTVRWHAISDDGHVVSGVFTFGVQADALLPTEAFGASGPTRTEDVVRWVYFLALALLVGGLGFRIIVLRGPLAPRAEKRFFVLTGIGVMAVIDVGIAAFILRAEDALQLPFGRLLYGDLSPIAQTRFGVAFIAMTLGYALVAALLFLAWLTDRRVFLWPAFLVALGFASGLSLSGHSAADVGSSWKSELADWAHLSAACLWIGGLVQLAFVVWPLMPEARRAASLAAVSAEAWSARAWWGWRFSSSPRCS
jgi:copper transport protein